MFRIRNIYETGATLYAFLRKVENGVETDIWDETNDQWVTGTLPLPSSAERITLTAGSGVEASKYTGATTTDLETYSGRVSVNIVDDSEAKVVASFEAEVSGGIEVSADSLDDVAALQIGAEQNKEQTVAIFVTKTSTAAAASGAVVTTQIAEAATAPTFSNTTNAAAFSGSKGIYLVTLTAAETNFTNPRLVRVTTDDGGTGDGLLVFGVRQHETDWQDGGALKQLLVAAEADTDTLVNTDVPALQTSVDALPSAADVADAVLDEAIASHVGAGSVGNLIERLDVIAAGGAGELTPARAGNLANLDAAITTRATPAQVNAEVGNSIVTYHLDHLFAASYNPAAKPGTTSALLNVMVENDGGVPRFTANALEAGSGGGVVNVAEIADAVWDEAKNDHTASGSFGELATSIAAILADTNELQVNFDTGGSLLTLLEGTATQTSVNNLNDLSTADVNTALVALGLDHLCAVAVTAPDVVDNSILAKLASATGDWSTFAESTDSPGSTAKSWRYGVGHGDGFLDA